MARSTELAARKQDAGAAPTVPSGPEEDPPAEVDLLTEKDLYKLLGVRRSAQDEELKKAYKKKSLKWHPDKNRDDPDAKEKFQRIAEAFSILSDKKKRLKYDKSGDLDLDDFDMDQFMNMWVNEMMDEGGMVDEMMQSVLPWRDDQEKMIQFMEESCNRQGKNWICKIDGKKTSNKRLMLAHFESKLQFECEDWAQGQIRGMKDSFESFMKQLVGVGDGSGEFILPDGTKADMSKAKGVPDIRGHLQKKVDKGMAQDKVLDLYRKVSNEDAPYDPPVKELVELMGVTESVAEELRKDRKRLLKRLKRKMDEFNDEEEDEMALLAQMEGLGGMGGLESMLGGLDPNDPGALEAMMAQMGGPDALLNMLGGMGDTGGMGGMGGMPPGFGGKGGPRGGMPPGFGKGGYPQAPARPAAPPRALETLGPGDRVRLKKFKNGTEGAVHENDVEGKTMLVQFDGDPETLKFAYKHLEAASPSGGLGGGSPLRREEPAAPPPAPTGAAADLAKLAEGDRVRVVDGRNFDKFHGGMVGTVVNNNVDSRNILIDFDEKKTSGKEPLQVAYRHLEPG